MNTLNILLLDFLNMKKTKQAKVIKEVISGLLDASLVDASFKPKELKQALKTMYEDGPEDFHLKFYYPIDSLTRTILSKKMGLGAWDKRVSAVNFIFNNQTFVEENLVKFIQRKEGSPCSADKSRWLVNTLVKHYTKGSPIDMNIGDKCYWKPHFWTGEEWIQLFEALVDLYYGNNTKYLEFLKQHDKR